MSRGGVILTRRDILRYIAAEGGKRADEIEVLLRLKDVDDVRSSLIRARTELGRREKGAREAIETARAEVNVTLGLAKYSDEGLLDQINASRQLLGGGLLESNTPGSFKEGIAPPVSPETGPSSVNPNLFPAGRPKRQAEDGFESSAGAGRDGQEPAGKHCKA